MLQGPLRENMQGNVKLLYPAVHVYIFVAEYFTIAIEMVVCCGIRQRLAFGRRQGRRWGGGGGGALVAVNLIMRLSLTYIKD